MGFNLELSSEGTPSCSEVEESKRLYMVTKSVSALGVNASGTSKFVGAAVGMARPRTK